MIALGYQEIVAIPLVDAKLDEIFRAEGVTPAVIGNPLAEDASVMRSSGTVGMIGALEWNLNHGQRDLRLFEIATRYELRDGAPIETGVLTLGATGQAREKTIYGTAREFAFADLKGDLDSLGRMAGGAKWQAAVPAWLATGQAAVVAFGDDDQPVGVAGQLALRVADQLKIRQPVFLAELPLELLLLAIEAAGAKRRFEPIGRFPAVERDFSLVLAEGVTFAQVEQAIRALDIPELRSVEAADLFRGGQVPAGKFSLMVRVTFQSMEATLTDEHVAAFSSRIVLALEEKLHATLRAS